MANVTPQFPRQGTQVLAYIDQANLMYPSRIRLPFGASQILHKNGPGALSAHSRQTKWLSQPETETGSRCSRISSLHTPQTQAAVSGE